MAQARDWKEVQAHPWLALVAWSAEPEGPERQLGRFTIREEFTIDITEVEGPVPDDLLGMYYVG